MKRLAGDKRGFVVMRGDALDSAVSKFLHSRDLRFWTEGRSVKINTLVAYAIDVANGGYSDPCEVTFHNGPATIEEAGSEKDRRVLENLFALGLGDIGFGTRDITFGPCRVGIPNRFVYCVSSTLDEAVFRAWHAKEGYDAVIKIPSVVQFAIAVQNADGGKKFGGDAYICDVTYADI